MINELRNRLATALGLALALVAGPVLALGLGQIEVKSRRDQPLVAEIPIISNDPAELEQLQARLASPDTFARIGLEPPQGVVSDLQFTVALDARGRPVIRVTSAVPVQQPLLTFLVEVDWGQGRLVREYSALLDTPQTVSAPAQPPIQAPTVAPSNTIIRAPETPLAATPLPDPAADAAAEAEPAPTGLTDQAAEATPEAVAATPATPAPPEPVAAPAQPPASEPAAATEGVASEVANEYGPVQRGETLGEIAARMSSGYSLDQTMLALLRANPEAFIGDNINLIKQGAVLRMPQPNELSQYSASEAAVVVRDQIEQWRQARQPTPQPAALVAETAPASDATPNTDRAARATQARLEIVPPSGGGTRRAGTRSGVEAGGEGDMLRQDLQQTKETLAARDAEVEELKTRLADLEKLQEQQQQLIALKDSELAAAQQRLATSNQQTATTATPAETTAAQAQPAQTQSSSSSIVPYLGGGVALLLGALGWWWLRRSKAEARAEPRSFNTEALAAGMPSAETPPAKSPVKSNRKPSAGEGAQTVPAPVPEPSWKANPDPVVTPVGAAAASAVPAVAPKVAPTWHSGGGVEVAPLNSAPAGSERIELARAYIDLGDVDTARSLLQEVVNSGDAGVRDEAARLLRELA